MEFRCVGNEDSLTELGRMYLDGYGVEQDYQQAKYFLTRAVFMGMASEASCYLRELKEMTDE